VLDEQDQAVGQAATFATWKMLLEDD
jgi:hypothetical protein